MVIQRTYPKLVHQQGGDIISVQPLPIFVLLQLYGFMLTTRLLQRRNSVSKQHLMSVPRVSSPAAVQTLASFQCCHQNYRRSCSLVGLLTISVPQHLPPQIILCLSLFKKTVDTMHVRNGSHIWVTVAKSDYTRNMISNRQVALLPHTRYLEQQALLWSTDNMRKHYTQQKDSAP